MKLNIEIIEKDELCDVTAYTGSGDSIKYIAEDPFSNPVHYKTKEGHRMVEYLGLLKEDLESLSLADILRAMKL